MNNAHPNTSFPCNFISKVLGKPVVEAELPADTDNSLQFAYSLLSSPNAEKVITWYFKDGLTQTEIGEKLQCSHTRIYAILTTSVKELSLGRRAMLFTHGYAYCVDKKIAGPWLLGLDQQVDPDLYLDLHVVELGLNTNTLNSLSRLKIETVRDLIQHTELELTKLPKLGSTGMTSIKTRLSELGLSLQKIQP